MTNSLNYPSATEQNTIYTTAQKAVSVFAKKFSYRLTKEDIEDIASDTYIRSISYYESYDRRKASLKTWVSTIAHNCVIDAVSYKEKRLPISCSIYAKNSENGEEFGVDERCGVSPEVRNRLSEYDADKELLQKELEACVRLEYSKLKEKSQRVIRWKEAGYGPQEIAEEEGCSSNAAAKRLWGARQSLKKRLAKTTGEFCFYSKKCAS